MKAKIESCKPTRTFGDPPKQVYEVVSAGIAYDCFDAKIAGLIGQEIEFEVKQPSDPKYHPTMRLRGEGGQQGGGKFGGRTFQIAFGQTAEGEKLRSKTMALSYAKDMVVQFMTHQPLDTFAESLANLKAAYETMVPLLHLDQVKDLREQSTQPQSGNGHKDLATLLAEMKPMVSLEALANWWKTIMPAFNVLSTEDQQKLVVAKDTKKAELSKPAEQSTRQPNF